MQGGVQVDCKMQAHVPALTTCSLDLGGTSKLLGCTCISQLIYNSFGCCAGVQRRQPLPGLSVCVRYLTRCAFVHTSWLTDGLCVNLQRQAADVQQSEVCPVDSKSLASCCAVSAVR